MTDSNHDFSRAQAFLKDAVQQRHFPGVSLCVTHNGETVWQVALGRFTYEDGSRPVTPETVYDLASLTKVMATTAMAMVLYERQKLDLEQGLTEVLPEFSGDDPRRKLVTLRMLLAHSSGLPAYARLFENAKVHDAIMKELYRVPLEADPLSRAEYSDIGFMLLAAALEKIAGEPLDVFCQREIFAPLQMTRTRFSPPPDWRPDVPPTVEDKNFRKRVIQGEVHDENASAVGGVSGHAGLFAPVTDVARFAECMLRGGSPILRPATICLFTTRETQPVWTSRALGWDTPSQPSQSGKYFSKHAYGHLGFTGTSLWIDPERGLTVTMLTNRTWPDQSSRAIKQVRPVVHDAIVEAIGNP